MRAQKSSRRASATLSVFRYRAIWRIAFCLRRRRDRVTAREVGVEYIERPVRPGDPVYEGRPVWAVRLQGSNGEQYGAFGGQGVVVSIPTRNADEKAVELRERRLPLVNEVEDKPWGWRSFHAVDPNGVILDFFHVYKEIDTPAPNEQS